MMPGTVLITGATGFIGRYLAVALSQSGFRVVRVARKAQCHPHGPEPAYRAALGEIIPEEAFQSGPVQGIVHCAYDTTNPGVNHPGTVMWAEQAETHGVSQQIYIGSTSARVGPPGTYAAIKYESEQWMVRRGYLVLKPGLVIGNGGLCNKLVATLNRFPIVPLIGGGRMRVHLTGIDSLSRIVAAILLRPGDIEAGKAYLLNQTSPVTLRDLLQEIRLQHKTRTLFVFIPYWLVALGVRLAAASRLFPTSFGMDNLRGLIENSKLDLPTHLRELGEREIDLRELVAQTRRAQ